MNELMISVNKRADRKARYQAETELFSAASKAYEEKWSVKPTPIKKFLNGAMHLSTAFY